MSTNEQLHAREARTLALELSCRFAAREVEHDRSGAFAADNVNDLRESGMLALTVPRDRGGLGADLQETTEVLRTLAHGSPSTALMLGMHTSILANYLIDPALLPESERSFFLAQRAWASEQASDGKIFAVANSEPGSGGDVHNSKAFVDDAETHLSGLKSFASFGANADFFMAAARNGAGAVEYYLVRNDPKHVTIEKEWDALGMRSSESVVLRFNEAPVVGVFAYRGMLDGANLRHWSTLSFTAIFLGIGESLFQEVRPKASEMLAKVEITDFHLQLQACRGFLADTVRREAEGVDKKYRNLVRDCKTFVTRSLAKKGLDVYIAQSGSAYSFSSPVSRKFRDLLAGPALRPPAAIAFEEIWNGL